MMKNTYHWRFLFELYKMSERITTRRKLSLISAAGLLFFGGAENRVDMVKLPKLPGRFAGESHDSDIQAKL